MTNEIGQGYNVDMKALHPKHYVVGMPKRPVPEGDIAASFGNMLQKAMREVNNKQVNADHLIIEAGTRPDSVNVHEVMNAVAEAELALNMTKAVTDRALRAYQEIINMR